MVGVQPLGKDRQIKLGGWVLGEGGLGLLGLLGAPLWEGRPLLLLAAPFRPLPRSHPTATFIRPSMVIHLAVVWGITPPSERSSLSLLHVSQALHLGLLCCLIWPGLLNGF